MTRSMDVDDFRRERGEKPLGAPIRAKRAKAGPLAKRKKTKAPSALEAKFLSAIAGLPQPEREHRFHPVRRWRFDFAWLDRKVAVEVHGGAWVTGGHNRAGHQASDNEKANTATLMGWKVLTFNTVQMKDLAAVRSVVEQAISPPSPAEVRG